MEGTRDGQGLAPDLTRLTPARVALGRYGVSLPTAALLAFGVDHARARDAVHVVFDAPALARAIAADGYQVALVESQAPSRADYLRRPDLGRRLSSASRDALQVLANPPCDIAVVLADGLSPGAVAAQAPAVLSALRTRLTRHVFAPVVIATQARVALGDEIGALLKARLLVVLIGERPGLSTPESLGAYLTYDPRAGVTDADRNCISNINPAGLSPDAAAKRIAWLMEAALSRRVSGITLKDDSAFAVLPHLAP